MLHFNNTLWMIFFQTVKPLTDNTGLVIILFSIFFGIGFSFLTFFYRKGKVHYLGVLDGLYLVSVYYMLRQLLIAVILKKPLVLQYEKLRILFIICILCHRMNWKSGFM